MPSTSSLRLAILSDLHLGRDPAPPRRTDADLVILAGDIARPEEAIAWARHFSQPVLYVPGNHEFYGDTISGTIERLKRLARNSNIHVLDNEEIVINGIRFLGSTLWTDFNLEGSADARRHAITEALSLLYDFVHIRSADPSAGAFQPDELEALFDRNRRWLDKKLSEKFQGPTVVITHHAPSKKSIHPRFEGSVINTCFVSDSEHLMGAERVALWIHGHTHNNFDYEVKGTRVLCNPCGYTRQGVVENPEFDPELSVEVFGALPATEVNP